MPVTPESPLAIALHAVCVAASISPTFQAWTGAADEEEALERTHIYSPPPPSDPKGYTESELTAMRPMVIVSPRPPKTVGNSAKSSQNVSTALNHYVDQSTIYVHFIDVADTEMNFRDMLVDFTNKYDQTVQDMLTLGSDRSDTPYVSSTSLVVEPSLVNEIYYQTEGKFIECVVAFNLGLRG